YSGLGYSMYTQFKRGLQMESLGASILMAGSRLGIHHVHVVVGQPYSLDIAGRAAAVTGVPFTLVLVAVLLAVYLAYAAGPAEPLLAPRPREPGCLVRARTQPRARPALRGGRGAPRPLHGRLVRRNARRHLPRAQAAQRDGYVVSASIVGKPYFHATREYHAS